MNNHAWAFGILLLPVLAGCGSTSSIKEVKEESQAVQIWSSAYESNCFAPRDYGTSLYPTDVAENPDSTCERMKLLDVDSELTDNGDTVWCFTSVWQSTWKFADDPGFGQTDITQSTWCYSFSVNQETGDIYYGTGTQRGSDSRLTEWPS